MDFAKSLMKKYGWKEGDGLGKNSDGIDKPLKANLKFDNSGLGHDKAADFNNHWWERVYNEAAGNIEVENGAGVSLTTKNEDALEISTKEYSVSKLKKLTGESSYNNFLKSATLSASGESENPSHVDMDEVNLTRFKPLTDEQLLAACGGRTAHKGARHGLKLSGKLARIEQQERELLSRMQNTSTADADPTNCQSTSKKKKKRKRERQVEEFTEQENQDELADLLYNAEYTTSSKKKRKEARKLDNELSSCLERFSMDRTALDEDGDTVLEPAFSETNKSRRKDKKHKKRKRKNKQFIPEPILDEKSNEKEAIDELDDQLTVNSLEVNISDSEEQRSNHSTEQTKSKKVRKREKRLMKKLRTSLENSVVITD